MNEYVVVTVYSVNGEIQNYSHHHQIAESAQVAVDEVRREYVINDSCGRDKLRTDVLQVFVEVHNWS